MSEKISRHLSFTVFKVAQIEELLKEKMCEAVIPEDAASTFVVATLADIRVGGDLAGYIPSKTYIATRRRVRVRSTAGKASWAASAHSRRRGMKYLVLDNKHYL